MLGISLPELIIIVVIAIMIVPAKEWPTLIKTSAKLYKKAQDSYYKLLRELNIMNIHQ